MKDKFIGFIFLSGLTFCHQPVMDMAPRWSGGYGFQVRYESFGSDQQINNELFQMGQIPTGRILETVKVLIVDYYLIHPLAEPPPAFNLPLLI